MSKDIPSRKEPLPENFRTAYEWAIHSLIRFQEETASVRLKHVFGLKADPADNQAVAMNQDLQDPRTQNLMYGDYKSDSSYPWINDPKVLGMIVRHARMMGEDEAKIQDFLTKTEQAYHVKPAAAAPRLVA